MPKKRPKLGKTTNPPKVGATDAAKKREMDRKAAAQRKKPIKTAPPKKKPTNTVKKKVVKKKVRTKPKSNYSRNREQFLKN